MEEQREQQPHHALSQMYPDACLEDEINLLDLWRVLARQWKVICAITGLSVLGAVAYVLLATPVYEAQAVVKQAECNYFEGLNIYGINKVNNDDIVVMFMGNLRSIALREQFVAENPQFSSLRGNVPKIKEGQKNEGAPVFVSLQGTDPKLIADWVNGFILLAEKKTIGDFFVKVETNIANQKREIQDELQIGRDFAGQRRRDRIALLEDQIAIARASKIFDRQFSGYSVVAGQTFEVTADTVQGPMYMRGVKELTAEKKALEKRKSDEPFIVKFRDKQEDLAQLDARLKYLQAVREITRVVKVDSPAIEAKRPVKPMRMRVLAFSVVLGGVLGIFAAFVINVLQQQNARIKELG